MQELYYSFSSYLKEKFKEPVWRIGVDSGFSCPNINGDLSVDGCIFCNNKGFGVYALSRIPVNEQIINSIEYYKDKKGIKKFIAYFQSFSNTYADPDTLKKCYDVVRKFPEIVGIFISTRPDCIDEDKIKLISSYKKDYLVWIEYGLQTTHNKALDFLKRHHTYEDFLRSLEIARHYGINVGAHMMLGIPGLCREETIEDAVRLSKLDLQGIKLHVLHVLKDTKLEEIYRAGKLNMLNKDEYVSLVCDFLENTPKDRVIMRLVSTAINQYLVAPAWINEKSEVIEAIKDELKRRKTRQGFLYEKGK